MSSRIQKIKDTYSQQLKDRLEQEKVHISIDSAWDILMSADPAKNKKNVRWLVETYLNDGYLWEDISSGPVSKVCETLTEFDKHKRKIENVADRSLTRYKTLGRLWKVISPFAGQQTIKEEKRSDRDKAYAESEIIMEKEDGLKIIMPKTEFASKWWGRGTRWCTAADNNNRFDDYAEDGPLIITVTPDGRKFQGYVNREQTGYYEEWLSNVQFMDENDETVSEYDLEQYWNELKYTIFYLGDIDFVPKRYRTDEIINEFMKKDGNNFYALDSSEQTDDRFKITMDHFPYILEAYKDYKISKDVAEYAIKKYPEHCNDILNLFDTSDDVELPEEQDELDRNMKDLVALLEASHSVDKYYKILWSSYKTPSMTAEAIKQEQSFFTFIPHDHLNNHLTQEICDAEFKKDPKILNKIPKKFLRQEYIVEALTYPERNYEFYQLPLPDGPIDDHVYDIMARNSINTFKRIPEEHKTYERRLMILEQNGDALMNFPVDILDEKLCLTAVQQKGIAIAWVPDELRTHAVMIAAIKNDADALDYIENNLRTKEMYNLYIERKPDKIFKVPKEFQDEEMWQHVISNKSATIDEKTLSFISKNPSYLDCLPKKLVTEELLNKIEQFKNKEKDIVSDNVKFFTEPDYEQDNEEHIDFISKVTEIKQAFEDADNLCGQTPSLRLSP